MFKKNVMIPAALMAAAACFWGYAISKERAITGQYEMTTALVARVDLPAKAVLNVDLVETMQVPRRYLQQDAIEIRSMSDIKLVNNLAAAIRIPKGNQILMSALVGTASKAPADAKTAPSQQHYLEGMKYFQNADYEQARREWAAARKLDPSNTEAAAALKRIEQILAGGK